MEELTQQNPDTITTLPLNRSFGTFKREFQLSDACGFVANGLQVGHVYCMQLLLGICDSVHIEYQVSLQLNCLIRCCITIPNANSMKLITTIDYIHIFISTTYTY